MWAKANKELNSVWAKAKKKLNSVWAKTSKEDLLKLSKCTGSAHLSLLWSTSIYKFHMDCLIYSFTCTFCDISAFSLLVRT